MIALGVMIDCHCELIDQRADKTPHKVGVMSARDRERERKRDREREKERERKREIERERRCEKNILAILSGRSCNRSTNRSD